MKYNKGTCTLSVRVKPDVAMKILGRLWAGGHISKEQYELKAKQVDSLLFENEMKKKEKKDKILKNLLDFYKR